MREQEREEETVPCLWLDEEEFVAMAEYCGADAHRARGLFRCVLKLVPDVEEVK